MSANPPEDHPPPEPPVEPTGRASPTATIPRAYVNLLDQVASETIDPDYQVVAARGGASAAHRPVALVLTLAVFGAMLGVAALKTEQGRSAANAERAELVAQIHQGQSELDSLHRQLSDLQTEVTSLQSTLAHDLSGDRSLTNQLSSLGVAAGSVAVTGPGLVVTTDDGPPSEGTSGVIRDTDLRVLVNALWQSGAEAIAVNGHRLTSLTAIRYAGRAITVDYQSLTPPYVIEVTGNPSTLPARLLATDGGRFWLGLKTNFGIRFDVTPRNEVVLPGDPHDHLLYARPVGGGTS